MSRIGHNYLWPKRPEAAINLILRIEKRKKNKKTNKYIFYNSKNIRYYILLCIESRLNEQDLLTRQNHNPFHLNHADNAGR